MQSQSRLERFSLSKLPKVVLRINFVDVQAPTTLHRLLEPLHAATASAASTGALASASAAPVRPAWLSADRPPLPAPIPIEVCPTSNSLTLSLPGLHHHPTLSPWLERDYPFSICTDDSGVFGVTLSQEYATVASTFGLSAARIAQLALQSFHHAFVPADERARLVAAAQKEIDAALAAEATGARTKDSTE